MVHAKKISFALIPSLFFLLILYSWSVVHRTNKLYRAIKTSESGIYGSAFLPDPELGAIHAPGSQGMEATGTGSDIPVIFDQNGFRVPKNYRVSRNRQRPIVLALGCSFTFGLGVAAQEAFPFLVAKLLSGTALNAGQSGYGITEMLILARRLIPAYKPDYVLVQFSPWLVSRSQEPFSYAPYNKYPRPYFAESPDDGDLYIQLPVFPAKMLTIPKSIYRYTPKNTRDYLSFLFKVGLPLYLYDDFHIAVYHLKRKAGMLPSPSQDREKIVRVAYMEIAKLCQENNSKMVIVILHEPSIQEASLGETLRLQRIENAIIVDTGPELINRLNEKISKSYYIAYTHVKGSPPIIIDFHPNELAHRIIAEQIARAIKGQTSSR